MLDAAREVLEAVTRHRLRALATAFGVFWGIFMLTLMLAGGHGLRNGLISVFEGARSLVWLEAGMTGQPYQGLGAGRRIMLDLQDIRLLERTVPELANVSPRQHLMQATVRRGNVNLGLPVFGVYDCFARIVKMQPKRGRLLNGLDDVRARKVAIIGERAATLLFAGANPVGDTLLIGGTRFTVVGEYKDPGNEDDNRRVYVPYSTLRQSFDNSPHIQAITASSPEGADEQALRTRIMQVLGRHHRFDPGDRAAMEVWFAAEEFKRVGKLMRGIDLSIVVVGLGTLLSGMVGVSNILFVSVRERAKEFGIRRALGASARSILAMVIAEALLLASCAGGLGLLSALLLVRFADRLGVQSDYFKDPRVDLETALWSLSTLVVTALVAGFFPAREAARMTPIAALRRE